MSMQLRMGGQRANNSRKERREREEKDIGRAPQQKTRGALQEDSVAAASELVSCESRHPATLHRRHERTKSREHNTDDGIPQLQQE
jgi:hypothetical protein